MSTARFDDPSVPEAPRADPDLAMIDVAVELSDEAPSRRAPTQGRVRILVDLSTGREVAFQGRILHGYDVVDVESPLFRDAAARAVVVQDAPAGCPTRASLWTDEDIEAEPLALRLTAGRIGAALETLVLGEAPDGGVDASASFVIDGPRGRGCSLVGRHRIEGVRRMPTH